MKRYGRCNDREAFCRLFNESTSVSGLGRKLGYKSKGNAIPGGVSKIIRQKIAEYGLDLGRLKGQAWNKGLTKHSSDAINRMAQKHTLPWDKCFRDGSTVKNQNLLAKLISSDKRKYICENCGISEWMGENIVLELHHINEKFNDNREENLRILCPNCHSLLKKGKYSRGAIRGAKSDSIKRPATNYVIDKLSVTDDDLCNMVGDKSIVEVGKILNISEKTVLKLCRIRNIKIPNKSYKQKKFEIGKDEMIGLLKDKSILQIGKTFGVSDNAIRKRCKTMGIDWKEISIFSHVK